MTAGQPGGGAPHPAPGPSAGAADELLRALAAPLRIALVVELEGATRRVHELVDAHVAHIVTDAVSRSRAEPSHADLRG